MRRTKSDAAETREAILISAEKMFLARGVNQSSLIEIAAQAGVTRGAIYFHFQDKLDIFRAIIGNARFPQEEIMLQAAKLNHPNPLHVLEQSILAALELFVTDERQQVIFTIINQRYEHVGDMAPIVERIKEARDNVLSLFTGLLDVAERRDELSTQWTARSASPILLALVSGLLSEWMRSEKGFDLVTDGSKAIRTFIKSLRKT
ncbi:TetR family transcriptional regulator [Brucellaceae bacterium D45D]